jgi:uncharacterized protein
LHDPASAHHPDGRPQAIGAEYSSCEFAEEYKGMGVWLAGDRPGERYSDLDLAIDAGRPLRLDEIAGLAEAFSDSDLRYKVDLTDWPSV